MALIEKQLKIGGMFCSHCRSTIQRGLRKLSGVQAVSASYQTGDASITYDPDRGSLREIEETVQALGYEVLPDARTDITRTVSLLAIIISLYVILQRFGVLNLLVPSQLAESGMGYGMLFLVGLLTSVHCIAMCGGINLSQSLPRNGPDIERPRAAVPPSLFYNLGRVVSYTAIGFLLGLAGLMLGGGSSTGIPVLPQGILKIIAGFVMVVMGVNMSGVFPWLRQWNPRLPRFLSRLIGKSKSSVRRPFAVGLLNGLMPCGPLQSMQILALASGSPVTGALSMLLFSLGTVPLMLGLGTLVSALGRRFARTVMNTGAVLVGDSTVLIVDGVQMVDSTLAPGQYPTIMVQSGGCNPWPIFGTDKTVTEDEIQISYDFLKESSAIFEYWKA